MIEEILLILLLVLLNGVFAMSEIAIVSAKKSKLEALSKKGKSGAKLALELSNNPTRFLSTVQAGITLIGIFTGVFSGASIADKLKFHFDKYIFLANYSEALALGIVVVCITFLSLIIGELVPKRVGLHNPEVIAYRMAPLMNFIFRMTSPLVWLLTGITNTILKLFSIRSAPEESPVTEEEVKELIAQGTSRGTFEAAEQDMVERVFNLSDRTIGSLMTNRIEIEWLDINDKDEENQNKIIQSNHNLFLVCDDSIDEVLGILSSKKYLAAISTGNFYGLKSLLDAPMFVPENMDAFTALEEFKATRAKLAVVVDEFGAVQGLVTMNDFFEALIVDHDEPDAEDDISIVKREDGSWLVDALLPFEEFLQYFEIEDVEAEDKTGFHTLGGFILHLSKSIPDVGEKFEWKSITFEVMDLDGNRIDKVLVVMPEETVES